MDGITFREAFGALSLVFIALIGVTYRMFNKTLILENSIIKSQLENQRIKLKNQRIKIDKLEDLTQKHEQIISDLITTNKYNR